MRKIRRTVLLATAISLAPVVVGPVLADDASSPTTTVVERQKGTRGEATKAVVQAIKDYKAALREWAKVNLKGATPEFRAAVKAYVEANKQIEGAYRDAVKAAITSRKAALTAATTKEARQAAQQEFTAAIADAQAVRLSARATLGAAPTK
jgi:hypothetical protein